MFYGRQSPLLAKGRRHSAAADLPDDVFVALVGTLFGMMSSLVLSIVSALMVSGKVAFDSGHPALLVVTVFVAVLGITRIAVLFSFRKASLAAMTREAAVWWERLFAITAWLYSACVGGLVLLTFSLTDYLPDHILVDAIACGVAAGAMSRNAGSAKIAFGQILCLILPICVAAFWHGNWSYFILGVINFLFIVATLDIIKRLNENMVGLLSTTREKTGLAASIASKNELLDAALGNMSHGLCLFDAEQRIVVANQRCQLLLNLPDALMAPGTALRDVISPDLIDSEGLEPADALIGRFEAHLVRREAHAAIVRLRDGRCLAVSQQPMADGGAVVLLDDITERHQSEARIAHLATHDPLTDLPNRTLFEDRLRSELTTLRAGKTCVLMYLDLDRFKTVNDTLGHSAGDMVLCETARRIRTVVGPDRLVARIGGDEFVVLANDLGESETVELADAIIAIVKTPYRLDAGEVEIGVSIGVARATDQATSAADLRKSADLALYSAKNDGRGMVRLFWAQTGDPVGVRRCLESDLRRAIQSGDFVLHYQPQFDLTNGRIVGAEALIRWAHPTRGLIAPDDFVPLAEETGLIRPLGAWVLRQACRDAALWPVPLRVAVNMSPAQLNGPHLLATIEAALAASGLPADRLDLELTESLVLVGNQGTTAMLQSIRSLGVALSMDDFGTGYSSMTCLRAFAFDRIKIDRSFVRDIASAPTCQAIVRALVRLGDDLGVPTVAEGVETLEQLDHVRALGCREVQGFLLGRPMPVEDLVAFLEQEPAGRAAA